MKVYDEDYGYIEKDTLRDIRLEEKKKKLQEIKARNKTYLKGQRGVRYYYDYDKRYKNEFGDYVDYDGDNPEEENLTRQVKCVYTKDLRLEKLFGYLKYLNGRKVLIRDLAFRFGVTERTIQHDLRWLESNGFLSVQTNKTSKGIQTQNSYIVNVEKEKDLPCDQTFLNVMFVSKINGSYYLLTKTDYSGRKQERWDYAIEDCEFEIPGMKERFPDRIGFHSLRIAKEIFAKDLERQYKGHILTHTQKYCYKDVDKNGNLYNERGKDKNYFTLFLLDGQQKPKEGYYWLKLSVASRRIRNRAVNKCIKLIQENIIGVK